MSEKKKEAKPEVNFEEAMADLESIVRQLEENDVPLEKAIDLFQSGMSLSKICHDKLETVGNKMDQLIDPEGKSEPFTLPGDDQQ